MDTICANNIRVAEDSKLFRVLNTIQAATVNASEYVVYADHSDYCIGLFDNG